MINQISIVIPTLNEEKYLPKLLVSLAHQTYQGKLDVIIVDGSSEDRTIEIASRYQKDIPGLRIITSQRGVARQRNVGADAALYDHLLFLDADIVLPPNCLERLAKNTRPGERFVDLALHLPQKFNLFDYAFIVATFTYIYLAKFLDPVVIGSFIFTTKENHKAIGGFDEGIVIAEDVAYGQRSIADGARYRLHMRPYVYASPRRVRREGRIGILKQWVVCHHHIRRHGHIYDPSLFPYSFGDHKGDE